MHACMLSCFSRVWLYATLWTAAHQAPLSTRFSRQEYWRGFAFLSPDMWVRFLQIPTLWCGVAPSPLRDVSKFPECRRWLRFFWMPLKEGVSHVLPLHTTWPELETQTQPYAQDLSKNTRYLLLQIIGSYLNYVLKSFTCLLGVQTFIPWLPSFIHSLETESWIQHTEFLQIKKKKKKKAMSAHHWCSLGAPFCFSKKQFCSGKTEGFGKRTCNLGQANYVET